MGKLDYNCMPCKLALFLGLPIVYFLIVSGFYVLKVVKTGQWEGLGRMVLQISSVLTSYLLI